MLAWQNMNLESGSAVKESQHHEGNLFHRQRSQLRHLRLLTFVGYLQTVWLWSQPCSTCSRRTHRNTHKTQCRTLCALPLLTSFVSPAIPSTAASPVGKHPPASYSPCQVRLWSFRCVGWLRSGSSLVVQHNCAVLPLRAEDGLVPRRFWLAHWKQWETFQRLEQALGEACMEKHFFLHLQM